MPYYNHEPKRDPIFDNYPNPVLRTLVTLDYGNYGIFLLMGNAGLKSSTVRGYYKATIGFRVQDSIGFRV